jgi:hypothetical protein
VNYCELQHWVVALRTATLRPPSLQPHELQGLHPQCCNVTSPAVVATCNDVIPTTTTTCNAALPAVIVTHLSRRGLPRSWLVQSKSCLCHYWRHYRRHCRCHCWHHCQHSFSSKVHPTFVQWQFHPTSWRTASCCPASCRPIVLTSYTLLSYTMLSCVFRHVPYCFTYCRLMSYILTYYHLAP